MLPFIIYIMELNIKTKFDVGQKVYIYQKDIAFKDGDFIKADKTTLGADNGLGVAYMLALLDSKEAMPNIECIFTSDEEIGLVGAEKIPAEAFSAK